MVEEKDFNHENNDLAYDLRQRYAKLVADHMELITGFRITKNYPEYFNALDHLYTLIEFKFKERKNEKEMTWEKIKKIVDSYDKLRKESITLANRYKTVWFGKSNDENGVAKIEQALKTIERYLIFKMGEANMFGSKREIEGLI
jgi:hypothetical protein